MPRPGEHTNTNAAPRSVLLAASLVCLACASEVLPAPVFNEDASVNPGMSAQGQRSSSASAASEPASRRVASSSGASSRTQSSSAGPASQASVSSSSEPNACDVDPSGSSFTFHIVNRGTQPLHIAMGCVGDVPLDLDGPGGQLPIATDFTSIGMICGAGCVPGPSPGLWDCSPEESQPLPPGATVDVPWDHRVFSWTWQGAPECVGAECTDYCQRGTLLHPKTDQTGVLRLCRGLAAPGTRAGWCFAEDTISLPLTVDTTGIEAFIFVED